MTTLGFVSAGIVDDRWLTDYNAEIDEHARSQVTKSLFSGLSSGQKIALLTMTRLVEVVVERSLVVIDEPEAHLHPPLLAALIRALSDLLADRNGLAILATHSPVVLQEVPASCVWKLRRYGDHLVADRPRLETFGENVGVLTHEVFGLEVTEAGFYRALRDVVNEGLSYDAVVDRFHSQLGGEARALVRALIAVREDRRRIVPCHNLFAGRDQGFRCPLRSAHDRGSWCFD
ncbi:AAA family ATPase [Saccharopolyspora elongata]|nr:AAA family ATPase [Saccharopolyspora elongata]